MDIDQLKEQLIADPEVRRMIAARAYDVFLERRGIRDAHPSEDWLVAENEILPMLIEQMLDHNRRAIASHDDADPVSSKASEHMREEIDRASASKPASKPAKAKAAPAAKSSKATKAAKPAAKKASAKKAPAKKAAPKKAAAAKSTPAAKATEKKPASRPARRKPAPKLAKPE